MICKHKLLYEILYCFLLVLTSFVSVIFWQVFHLYCFDFSFDQETLKNGILESPNIDFIIAVSHCINVQRNLKLSWNII